jgi:hypothetical protein
MSYIEDYGLTSPSRKYALLALALKDRKHCKEIDIIHLQKIIRYFEYLKRSSEIKFSFFKYGVVSHELAENLDTLLESGLVDKAEETYSLTEEGQEIAEKMLISLDKGELEKLTFAKQQLNDLTVDELMYFMYRLIPESVVNSIEFPRLEKKRTSLVQNLFLKGRINAITAAKWLDISEKDFLDSLCK